MRFSIRVRQTSRQTDMQTDSETEDNMVDKWQDKLIAWQILDIQQGRQADRHTVGLKDSKQHRTTDSRNESTGHRERTMLKLSLTRLLLRHKEVSLPCKSFNIFNLLLKENITWIRTLYVSYFFYPPRFNVIKLFYLSLTMRLNKLLHFPLATWNNIFCKALSLTLRDAPQTGSVFTNISLGLKRLARD